jgi:glycerol-3-phosphate cytidylyltransferase
MVFRVITFGTFDLFHIGHLNILKQCRELENSNTYVIVGVSSDELNKSKKNRQPIVPLNDRMEIVRSVRYVDSVFVEKSLQEKVAYCKRFQADVCIMGDDHKGKFDFLEEYGIRVIYVPRTEHISTTRVIQDIRCIHT